MISGSFFPGNERASSFACSRRTVGVHRPRTWTWYWTKSDRGWGRIGRSYCTQGNLASGPDHLFPEPRTATSFSSTVQPSVQRGVPPHGPLLNPWSWAEAADQRWARRPRRSILGTQRLHGLIHVFRCHCQVTSKGRKMYIRSKE